MTVPTFEWDRRKAETNREKHGVRFEEAVTVFRDPLGRVHVDPHHSDWEPREILIGHSSRGRLLLVAFTDRRGTIRVISARRATPGERRDYEESR
jgi:hypothetical protein